MKVQEETISHDCLYTKDKNAEPGAITKQSSKCILIVQTKHRKNCECCPGHYLNCCLCSHCSHCSQCLLVSTSVFQSYQCLLVLYLQYKSSEDPLNPVFSKTRLSWQLYPPKQVLDSLGFTCSASFQSSMKILNPVNSPWDPAGLPLYPLGPRAYPLTPWDPVGLPH